MSQQLLSRALVSINWLAGALRTSQPGPALRVLDASFYYPPIRDGRKEYVEKHIPGALYFDINECKDQTSPYEMMLPSESAFAKYVGNLGINNDTHVIVYDADQVGIYYAARIWWMFKVFGHKKVFVLDGGFRNWEKEGHPVTSEVTKPQPENYKAVLNSSLVKKFEDIQQNLNSKEFQLVDSRSEGRYTGTEPEPGDEIFPGHIPGSLNLPFTSFLTEEGFEKSPDEIQRLFQDKGIDLEKPLTITCRRGVTACQLALASYILGLPACWSAPPDIKEKCQVAATKSEHSSGQVMSSRNKISHQDADICQLGIRNLIPANIRHKYGSSLVEQLISPEEVRNCLRDVEERTRDMPRVTLKHATLNPWLMEDYLHRTYSELSHYLRSNVFPGVPRNQHSLVHDSYTAEVNKRGRLDKGNRQHWHGRKTDDLVFQIVLPIAVASRLPTPAGCLCTAHAALR